MARRRSSVKGDFKLRGLLRRIHGEMDNELRPAMQQAAALVLQTQQNLIPVDTGEGKAALQVRVSKQGLDARVGIIGKRDARKFFYLRFVEYGTKGSKGKRGSGPENRSDGANFFGYSPDIPARPAHPWLRPSYDMNRDEIRSIISNAIASTLSRAAKGVVSG